MGVLLVVAIAASVVFGGRTVLWCPWMQQVMVECCCDHGSEPSDPSISRASCCETKVVEALPTTNASTIRDLTIRAASQVGFAITVLPGGVSKPAYAPDTIAVFARARGTRAGPDGPIYELNCVYRI